MTTNINNINFNGKTILNLNNGATVSAEGNKKNKHCKPVLCIERGKVYTSIYDAATDNSINPQYLSKLLINNDGYLKRKNLHFKYLTDRDDGLDAMTTHLQKLSENYDELVAKAKAYDALMEAEAKAREEEEKRQKAIERLETRISKHQEKLNKEEEIIRILKAELEALMNG
jgi:predicted metal-dependent hydrolase